MTFRTIMQEIMRPFFDLTVIHDHQNEGYPTFAGLMDKNDL